MVRSGSAPATANQAHRTIRTALGEAERRGRVSRNPAKLAKAPRPDEIEVEPYTVDEVRQLLKAAGERRNRARWAVALALGLRQGEVLGLRWSDVDLETAGHRLPIANVTRCPRWPDADVGSGRLLAKVSTSVSTRIRRSGG
jgi:integrase